MLCPTYAREGTQSLHCYMLQNSEASNLSNAWFLVCVPWRTCGLVSVVLRDTSRNQHVTLGLFTSAAGEKKA